jgi:crossover junction endodeoxyribonuclease RusA
MAFYVPKKYKDFEKFVKHIAKLTMGDRKPFAGDCVVNLNFYFDTRRIRDLFNLPKSIGDAMNKVVYKDDRQIKRTVETGKYYDKQNPRVEVEVFETDLKWYATPPREQSKK